MWPNIFSPNFWTIVAIACHLVATLAQQERHHQEMKQHVTATAAKEDHGQAHPA
jgi:hypothetical protein